MPVYKCQFFFRQLKYGWSDTFYLARDTTQSALDAAVDIAPSRIALLGGDGSEASPYLAAVRVSDVAVQRDSLIDRYNRVQGSNRIPLGPADIPSVSILLRCESGPNYRRQWYLRGQPDGLVTDNGVYKPDALPGWLNVLRVFVNTLIARGVGIYAIAKPPAATPILELSAVEGNVAVNTAAAHGLASNDSVRIVGAPGANTIRGNWRVKVTLPTQFVLIGAKVADHPIAGYLGGGTFYKRLAEIQPFSRVIAEEATKKSTGGPFDRPVGRRRRRTRV